MKNEVRVINENIKNYTNYNNTQISLFQTLDNCKEFINVNSMNPPSPITHNIA
jgi:hypothetical protein